MIKRISISIIFVLSIVVFNSCFSYSNDKAYEIVAKFNSINSIKANYVTYFGDIKTFYGTILFKKPIFYKKILKHYDNDKYEDLRIVDGKFKYLINNLEHWFVKSELKGTPASDAVTIDLFLDGNYTFQYVGTGDINNSKVTIVKAMYIDAPRKDTDLKLSFNDADNMLVRMESSSEGHFISGPVPNEDGTNKEMGIFVESTVQKWVVEQYHLNLPISDNEFNVEEE